MLTPSSNATSGWRMEKKSRILLCNLNTLFIVSAALLRRGSQLLEGNADSRMQGRRYALTSSGLETFCHRCRDLTSRLQQTIAPILRRKAILVRGERGSAFACSHETALVVPSAGPRQQHLPLPHNQPAQESTRRGFELRWAVVSLRQVGLAVRPAIL